MTTSALCVSDETGENSAVPHCSRTFPTLGMKLPVNGLPPEASFPANEPRTICLLAPSCSAALMFDSRPPPTVQVSTREEVCEAHDNHDFGCHCREASFSLSGCIESSERRGALDAAPLRCSFAAPTYYCRTHCEDLTSFGTLSGSDALRASTGIRL